MTTLTVEIPKKLEAALRATSARRQMPESDVVRELLEQALMNEMKPSNNAELWVAQWRGQLRGKEQAAADDGRLSHLLNKHLR
jgi:plasmid stability protein